MSTRGKPRRLDLGRLIKPARPVSPEPVPPAATSGDAVPSRSSPQSQLNDQSLVAGMALEIWRFERRVDRIAVTTGEDTVRPLRESLRRLNDLMIEHRLELRQHDGEVFADGHQFEVVHVREEAGPLVVVETVQPSIVLVGRIIRQGQVVLGAPTPTREEAE